MAQRGKKASGRRNVLILVALVVVVGVLAFSARFLQSERVYIVIAGPEELVQRAENDDNSYRLLFEALERRGALPAEMLHASHDLNRELVYRPRPDRLPQHLYAVWRDAPEHPLRAYAEAGAPAAEKAREALQKPYFLYPNSVGAFEDRPEGFSELAALLALRAFWLLDQGEVEAGLTTLLDAQELARRLSSYDRYWNRSIIFANLVLQGLDPWLQAQEDPALLALVQFTLESHRPYPTKREALEAQWLRIDETVAGPRSSAMPVEGGAPSEREVDVGPGMGRRMGMRFFINQVVQASTFFIAHREELLQKADGPARELLAALDEGIPDGFFNRGARYVMDQVSRYVAESAQWGGRYESLVALSGVKRYQLDHGALPESLDSLVPEYLDAVPIDPYNNRPVRYRNGPEGAILYSHGYNTSDEQGAGDDQVYVRISP